MRQNGVFHPLWFYHARPTVNSAMIATIEVFRATGELPEWDGTDGMEDNLFELIWRGPARIQPNKDWRARPREFAGEYTATQAVRFQLPIGGNELGPDVEFRKDDEIHLVEIPVEGPDVQAGNIYFVRNALMSSNAWLYNLLADVNTKSGGQSG